MSIRITIVSLFIATFVIYAWKDWFKSLCVLLLFTGIHMDRSIPTGMLGIQGLNHWNILFIGVLLGWRLSGRTLRLAWDAPVHTTVLFLMFLGVILVGMLRAILDRSHIEGYPLTNLISDRFINTIKWTVPGLLLFHGCRTRKQVVLAIMAICGMYLILALQVVYRVPWQCALGEASDALFRARGKACRRIGYNACDVSAFLSGASWGILAVVPLVRQKRHQVLVLAAAGIVTFGQALTGGRAGYLAWLATGSVLCL
ncbi:MAG: hypothetical protein FJY85_02740, partial [Deltaproteobacteria bacterium]|nr:hypothetical protein [Deltaproteobacteria bacterium]